MSDEPTTIEPEQVQPTRPPEGGDRARQIGLAAIAFAATLIVLAGISTLVSGRGLGADRASATPATASASAPPAVTSSVAPSSSAPLASTPSASPSASAPPSPSVSAAPSASPVTPQVLVGAGDVGDCSTEEDSRTADLLDDIEGTVFTAGDNAYENGSAEDFATCFEESWGRHKDRIRPAPGNHDWHTSGLSGYVGYFGDAGRGPDGRSWYSYDLGSWHVVVLDSECGRVDGCGGSSDQGRWLTADLAASDARCTIAIWHKPRFSSGEHGNDPSVGPFWTALHRAGADVVVNGHDHDYERFAPQDPGGREDRERGIRQFVAGTGGTPLRTFGDPVANSELRAAVAHGVLKLTLRDGSYDWEFISVGGAISDRGTAFCH
jgi:hypothetical protein